MDISGKVVLIEPTHQISDNFQKRNIVIEYATNPEYPEVISLEFVQDRTELLDNYEVGQEVTVWFDVTGRKWEAPDGTTKYFNTLKGWRIQLTEDAGKPEAPAPALPELPSTPGGQVDEIPF